MKRIAIPMMGNYSIVFDAMTESLGVEGWTRNCSTKEILELGMSASPESSCIPFKVYTGHFIKAASEGVEYAVMVNSCGTCRLRYYQPMQRIILKEMGFDIRVFGLGYDGIKPPMIKYFNPKMWPFLKSMARAIAKLKAVDMIETNAWRCRAMELKQGDTTRLSEQLLKELSQVRVLKEIRKVRRSIDKRFNAIAVDETRKPLRIGLIGEASVLRDKFVNNNIEERLGNMHVQVQNFFLLGKELKKIFHFGFRSSHAKDLKVTRKYLTSATGGHALETIANSIRCANDGYDGIIHMCPSGCMPEISMRPILKKLSRDYKIPILEISLDEHTSSVGITTRLDAFVDILHDRREHAAK
jgi:predicted nucleotide-binding protein (sugar kinase/HSP70/actin superfamily)